MTCSILASPPWGGLTLRILQASSRVRPDENALPEEPFPLAPCLDAAEACLYASAKARPNTRAPVKTTWPIIRWACNRRRHDQSGLSLQKEGNKIKKLQTYHYEEEKKGKEMSQLKGGRARRVGDEFERGVGVVGEKFGGGFSADQRVHIRCRWQHQQP